MSGVTFDPGTVPLARPSAAVLVFRYDPSAADPGAKYQLLPHVRCLQVSRHEGAAPPSARFRYAFDDPLGDPKAPSRFEEVYPFDAVGPYVVRADDRLVVRAYAGDGSSEYLFDGFVQPAQADLGPETETVSFVALGTPVRERDTPLGGAVVRNAFLADAPGEDTATDLPARFNPDGMPNASPAGADSGAAPAQYPVFLGPFWPANKVAGNVVRAWTLGMAARYLIGLGNPSKAYTTYDDLTALDAALQAACPPDPDDAGAIDEADDVVTYRSLDVIDFDATGEPWPDALERLIAPHGFSFRWVLSEKAAAGSSPFGDPSWTFKVYRKDGATPLKSVSLQQAGGAYDPGRTNLGALALARDTQAIANRIAIDAAPVRYEASFVLAPLFVVDPADVASKANFVAGNAAFTGANRDKYRLYGFNECGEGYWDFTRNATSVAPGDLAPLLNPKGLDPAPFVARRRPGVGTLLTTDDAGRPLRAQLHVSNDYAGTEPALWDGLHGTWDLVTAGGWKLCDDRLGILVTCDDPNAWPIAAAGDPGEAFPSGKLCLVEQTAAPGTTAGPRPRFRLTVCVDADQDVNVVAPRRAASPTRFAVTRRIEARDRYRKHVVSHLSALSALGFAGGDDPVTDDTDKARAYADGMRRAHECGEFAGSATVPRLSTAYELGDKISAVDGRGVSLRTGAAAEAGEGPTYPSVVAITWDLDGRQETRLELTDRRAEPVARRTRDREQDA